MTRLDWKINIENNAASVAEKCGQKLVDSVFERYDATCFEDLSPSYYGEAFGDLAMIDSDN